MRTIRLISLRYFLMALVLLAILPLLGLMLYTTLEIRQREIARMEAEALQMAHVFAIQEQKLVETTRQLLVALSHVPALMDEDPQACQDFLADLQTHYQRYASLGVIAPDGAVSCSAVLSDQAISVAEHAFFQQALSSGEFTIGEYQIDPISNEAVIPFAYPVYDEANQVQAVIFAALKMNWLNQVELEVLTQLPEGWTLTQVDHNGVVLVHEPDPTAWEGRSATETPLVQTVLEREQGVAQMIGLDDAPGVYAFAPVPSVLPGQSLFVILGIPRSIAFVEYNRVLLRSLAWLGLVVAAALVGTWAMSNAFILRPVEALLDVEQQLTEGDLSARVRQSAKPQEFAQLSLALNQMADSLERRNGELSQATERLSILHEMDGAILEAKSPDEIAFAALSRITQIIRCVRACVVTYDFETHEMVTLAIHEDGETRSGEGARVSLEVFEDLELEMLRRGEEHLLENASSLCQPSAADLALRVTVPIALHNDLIGSLSLELDEPEAMTPDHMHIAREVADSLAVAIHSVRLLEEVRTSHKRLQALSARLLEVQEMERRHLARELHDEVGQALTSVKINLQTMKRLNDSSELATYLEDGIRIIDRALNQVRALSFDLRPSLLDDLGLVPALRSLVDRQAQRAGFSASVDADPTQRQIPPQVETACYRIVQEALTNVIRHAQAQNVIVKLRVDHDELDLLIRDDGAGFDARTALQHAARGGNLGLLGMEERATLAGGRLTIKSDPGQGTDVRALFTLT
jgi:signal transduction histidine kinase